MEISKPAAIYFSIILIIGALTTFTDLKSKKIYNQHLILGAILGIIATTYAAIFCHEHIFFHFVNGLVAFIIGFLLHRSSLWRGGDAKLFTIYAFLMPLPVYSLFPFPGVINLFACSFIAGTAILLPVFIKDILVNHNTLAKELFLPEKYIGIFTGVGTAVMFSWISFPVYYLARITNPIIILTVSYLVFNWGYSTKLKINLKKILIESFLGFIFGLVMRLWLSPDSLSYPALRKYLTKIVLSSVIAICIHTTLTHFKDYQERVPFAPLLFIGCILSYTAFLTRLMYMVTQCNALLSR